MSYDNPLHDDVHAWTYRSVGIPLNRRKWNVRNADAVQRILRSYRLALRDAHRIAVDDATTRLVRQVSMRAERLPMWLGFARLPFDKVWIECDGAVLAEAMQRGDERSFNTPDLRDVPRRRGFLMRRERASNRWSAVNFDDDRGRIAPTVTEFVFDPDGLVGDARRGIGGRATVDRVHGIERDALYRPMGVFHEGPGGTHVIPDFVRGYVDAVPEPINLAIQRNNNALDRRFARENLDDMSGVLHQLVMLLAVINQVPGETRAIAPRTGWNRHGVHRMPHLSHETITIHVPKRRDATSAVLAALGRAYRARHKAHDVRGHWRRLIDRRTRVATGRIWIEEHMRGDPALGYVKRDYRTRGRPPDADAVAATLDG